MSDQLDMFASGEPVTEPVTADTLAQMISEEQARPEKTYRPVVTAAVFDVMTRFLAGMMFREGSFEKLPADKRKTAERAAQAAADVFVNETEETHE